MKKRIYMWLVTVMAWLARLVPARTPAAVFLLSFANQEPLVLALAEAAARTNTGFVVYYLPQCQETAARLAARGVQVVAFHDGFKFVLTQLKPVMHARLLFCDNYYAFLAGCHFKSSTTVVQVWHANGAIKTFGWQEARTKLRSAADKRRFQQVYDQFDEILVGSKQMAQVFAASYHIPESRCVKLGYPIADQLFDQTWQHTTQQQLQQAYPTIAGAEVIVYAPTYRETQAGEIYFELPNDFAQVVNHLTPTQRLVIKLHPHTVDQLPKIKQRLQAECGAAFAQVIFDEQFSTTAWLTVAARLITDYSSVIFDYSLLPNAKQMVIYGFDLDHYQQIVGLQPQILRWLTKHQVSTAAALTAKLQQPASRGELEQFNQAWNTYNDGQATARICQRYFPITTN